MADENVNVGLKVKSSVLTELHEAFAVRFGYQEKVILGDPKWKATKKQPKRPTVNNPVTKGDFYVEQLKVFSRRILSDHRAEKELALKRLKQKEVKDLI